MKEASLPTCVPAALLPCRDTPDQILGVLITVEVTAALANDAAPLLAGHPLPALRCAARRADVRHAPRVPLRPPPMQRFWKPSLINTVLPILLVFVLGMAGGRQGAGAPHYQKPEPCHGRA